MHLRGRGAELRLPTPSGDVVFNGHTEPHKTTEFALVRDADGHWSLVSLARNVKNLVPQREGDEDVKRRRERTLAATATATTASDARAAEPRAQSGPTAVPTPSGAREVAADAEVDAADLFGDSELDSDEGDT